MNYKLLIFGMALVTMLPRILPFYAFDTNKIPPFLRRFLGFVPFTVLGALILPGGFDGISGELFISILCLTVAIMISWFKGGLIGPILGAVGTAMLLQLIGFY